MTTFDKREEGFEKQFAHDEELKFKANARRNKLLGLWAAEKLGLAGAEADAYAKAVVMADFERGRRRRRVRQDPRRFRCQGRGAVRPPDPPHHGRTDGQGGRRYQVERMTAAARTRPNALGWRPHRIEKIFDRLRYRPWFADKDFTTDWTSGNFTTWRRALSPLRNEPLRILEIGSWEGRSAVFFLNFFPRATIVCIDTFGGTPEEDYVYDGLREQIRGVEDQFDRNL